MKGYNNWKKYTCGTQKETWRYPNTSRSRAWQEEDGFEDDDFGYDDSYDYSEHVVGNTAAQHQRRREENPEVVVRRGDEDSEWEDVEDDAAAYIAPKVRPMGFDELMDVAIVGWEQKAARSQRQKQRKVNATSAEAKFLLAKLEERGFTSDVLKSASISTLRQVVDEVDAHCDSSYVEEFERNDDEGQGMMRTFTSRVFDNQREEDNSSSALNLPQDCWTEVCSYLTMLPIVRLSSSCTYLRSILEDTDAFRRAWSQTSVNLKWATRSNIHLRACFYHNDDYYPRLPPRQYRWSWHLSLRRICLQLTAKTRFYNSHRNAADNQNIIAVLDRFSNELRLCDASAWLQLFLHTPDTVAREYARIQANAHAGMGNIALALVNSFDFDNVDDFVRKKLRIPATQQAIEDMKSSIRVQSLDTLAEKEFDVADVTEQLALRYQRKLMVYDEEEDVAEGEEVEMSHAASSAAISKIFVKDKDTLFSEFETFKQNEARIRTAQGRKFHVKHPRWMRRKATMAERRLLKQMENVGTCKVSAAYSWGRPFLSAANQEETPQYALLDGTKAHHRMRKGKNTACHGANFETHYDITTNPWMKAWLKGH